MPIIFAGIAVEAVLGVILVKTGRGVLLLAMIGVLVLVLGGVALEALVVTDRERVEAALDGGAAAFVDGDVDRVLTFVAPDATGTQAAVRQVLRRVDIDAIKITDLTINLVRTTSPPTARASMVCIVSGREKSGTFAPTTRPVRVEIQLRQQGERWLVIGHKWPEVVGGF